MSERVTLIVKAANQSSLDQRIECSLDWNVQYIKEEISKTHPAKPSVQEQRLIYSGQLLQDLLPLRTILRHPSDNNEYTIHLVCSSPKSNSNIKRPQDQPTIRTLPSPSVTPLGPSENNSHSEAPPDLTGDGVRHRSVTSEQPPLSGAQQQEIDTSTLYPYYSQLPFPLQTPADPIQQIAAVQHMYAQYMTSYMQYIQSGNIESGRLPQDVFPNTPSSSPVGSPSPSETQEQQNNARPQPQVPNNGNEQEAQRNAQMRVNPQGVGDDEEEGVARDWLDYIYFGSRMVVLLSIIYFYSTLTRFMVVACTTVLIYLYQCGWFRLWRVEEQQQQQPQQPQEPQPPANQGEANGAQPNAPPQPPSDQPGLEESGGSVSRETLQEGESEAALEGNDDSTEFEEGVQNAVEGQPSTWNPLMVDLPPQPSILALSWTFLTTFFTSLIPEQHQIV